MLIDIFFKLVVAGLVMLLWLRAIAATDFGKLSWPFAPLEYIIPMKYNSNVRFAYGVVLWIIICLPLAFLYVGLVEFDILLQRSLVGSGLTFGFLLWVVTVVVVFPWFKLGLAGYKSNSQWLWLESIVSWLLFGLVFGLLMSY